MKCLIIGGNRFVGLRLSHLLDQTAGCDLHILNRTGQVAFCQNAAIHKGDRRHLGATFLDRDWDVVVDFACFNEADASDALKFFGNVSRYIFVSTFSVYDSCAGKALKEEDFNPATWDLNQPVLGNYQDDKRRAEAVFTQRAEFPVLSVRFPFILGPDDYTQRLQFHVDHILKGEPLYIQNPDARISLIQSEDAAKFLHWSLTQKLAGPLNVASRDPISMAVLLAQIELITGHKPALTQKKSQESNSPYAPEVDHFVDCSKLFSAGFQTRPISEWLPPLIGTTDVVRSGRVH